MPSRLGREAIDTGDLGIRSLQGQPTNARNGRRAATTDAISPPQRTIEAARDGADGAWLDTAITLAVALVAAAASYGHMLDVALLAGEPVWIARAFPITV
jgi:hypothetical protein